MMRSTMPPRTAAVTPSAMPRIPLSRVAPAAREAVTGSLLARSALTDRPSISEIPRSPWTAPPSHVKNWTTRGSDQPRRRLTSSMASWEAPAPRDTAPGLPGIACTSMNASTATTSTVASAISRRLVMNSAMVTSIGQALAGRALPFGSARPAGPGISWPACRTRGAGRRWCRRTPPVPPSWCCSPGW
jgi:hypothetical protein